MIDSAPHKLFPTYGGAFNDVWAFYFEFLLKDILFYVTIK